MDEVIANSTLLPAMTKRAVRLGLRESGKIPHSDGGEN
jgi:hypothetical protein